MEHSRLRRIKIPVSVDPGAPAYIDILEVGKMSLIKIADFFKDDPPINRGSRAGCKDLCRLLVEPGVFILSPGEGPAEGAIVIACVVDLIRLGKL